MSKRLRTKAVMPGLVPGIHVLRPEQEDVDGRVKPGHDEGIKVETRVEKLHQNFGGRFSANALIPSAISSLRMLS
jgi:hypothetical protein